MKIAVDRNRGMRGIFLKGPAGGIMAYLRPLEARQLHRDLADYCDGTCHKAKPLVPIAPPEEEVE